jgi:hypothetical protein
MPFREDVRVEVFNVSAAPIAMDAAIVEHEPGPVDAAAGYLHAEARESILVRGQEYHVLASATGAGHYVGNLLYIRQERDTFFFLEGDDIVIVDGGPGGGIDPRSGRILNGTGIEDAYNGGYYYNWAYPLYEPDGFYPPFAIRPLHGILAVERTSEPPLGRTDQYRWQIADRISFTESIEVRVETKAWAGSQWQSVAFWYQLPPTASDVLPGTGAGGGVGLELRPAVPNPFAESTLIRFSLASDRHTVLDVLDIRGRSIETLVDGVRLAGPHEIRWSPRRLPNGVYFVRLQAEGHTDTRKVVVVR